MHSVFLHRARSHIIQPCDVLKPFDLNVIYCLAIQLFQ
jgi:hypothetical protein